MGERNTDVDCCCFLLDGESYVILLRYKASTKRYKENIVEMCI